jgi:hypothetical protein
MKRDEAAGAVLSAMLRSRFGETFMVGRVSAELRDKRVPATPASYPATGAVATARL